MKPEKVNPRGRKGGVFSLRALCSLGLIFLATACVPAVTPPLLGAPTGEAVMVTSDSYANGQFSLSYPTGWRVITSPVGAAPSVTLVAPDDCALIVVAAESVEAPAVPESCQDQDILSETRTVRLDSRSVTLAGSAPLSGWNDFLIAFEHVAGSIEAGL